MLAQRGTGKREHGGVDPGGFAAHEERLVAEEICDCVDRSRRKREDFLGRMSPETLATKGGPQLATDNRGHKRSDRSRDLIKELDRAPTEIILNQPPVMHDPPVELVLGHFLEGPGVRLLGSIEATVKVDAV